MKEIQSCLTIIFAELVVDPKVDGAYTEWSSYGACSVSCGGGTQRRDRSCTNPAPQHGGKSCDGPAEETKSCNNMACPGTRIHL